MELAALLLGVAVKAYEAYEKHKQNALQSGEMTPEQAAELDAQFETMFKKPSWQPEQS